MVRALACHAGDLGSIPGVCLYFILFLSHLVSKKVEFKTFLNPFSLKVQRLYCFYYIHIRSQNPIEKSFVMLFEVTNLKWIWLGGKRSCASHHRSFTVLPRSSDVTDHAPACGPLEVHGQPLPVFYVAPLYITYTHSFLM